MKSLALTMVCLLAANAGPVEAAGDPAAGKAKAATCIACHGPDGNSPNPEWPSLAGQHAKYLVNQIAAFQQSKTRQSPIMAPMVAGLSAQDMQDLGSYFATQPRRGLFANGAAKDKVTAGEKLYRGGNKDKGVPACMACH